MGAEKPLAVAMHSKKVYPCSLRHTGCVRDHARTFLTGQRQAFLEIGKMRRFLCFVRQKKSRHSLQI